MSETNIVTQSDVQSIKAKEQTLVQNLSDHANASLSKAHGFELLYTTGLVDGDGNDLSTYQDSNGDLVGSSMMRITDPNSFISHYVPLNASTLSPQPETTGVETTTAAVAGVQESSVWITDIATEAVSSLNVANSQLLLPHTQLSHWEAHTAGGLYTITAEDTLDSAGHVVANYVADIVYKGSRLKVPCSRRLGGPVQPPRILRLQPATASLHTTGTAGDYGIYFSPVIAGGTKPMTFEYYYNTDLPANVNDTSWAGPIAGTGITQSVPNSNGNDPFDFSYSSATGAAHIINGGGAGGELRLLLKVTNPSGITDTIYGTSNLVVFVFYFSHSSECWFCTEGHKHGSLPFSAWKTLLSLAEPAERLCPAGVAFYFEHGHELVERMKQAGVSGELFHTYATESVKIAAERGAEAAAAYQVDFIHRAGVKYWPDCPHYQIPAHYYEAAQI